jgi:hypothetical protein
VPSSVALRDIWQDTAKSARRQDVQSDITRPISGTRTTRTLRRRRDKGDTSSVRGEDKDRPARFQLVDLIANFAGDFHVRLPGEGNVTDPAPLSEAATGVSSGRPCYAPAKHLS